VRQVSQNTSLQIVPPIEETWFSGTMFSNDGELIYFVSGNRKNEHARLALSDSRSRRTRAEKDFDQRQLAHLIFAGR